LTIATLGMIAIFLMACFKWVVEGIWDQAIIEAVISLMIIGIMVFNNHFKIKKNNLIWLPFMVNIVLSLFLHTSTFGLWGRGLVTVFITAMALLIDEPIDYYGPVLKMIVFVGLINAALVLIHYFNRDFFEITYYNVLNPTAQITFNLYTRYGYFFGLLYNPHEPACLISFAFVGLFLWEIVVRKSHIYSVLPYFVLVIPLLMTGKKGIFFIAVISLVIIVFTIYGSRKQWKRIFIFLATGAIIVGLFFLIAMNHPELVFFNRFRVFFVGLMNGTDIDSGRNRIYEMALTEWKNNLILGIGWRHFNALTVEKYCMTQYHEVNLDYLQWLCETGIVGFVLNIIAVGTMLYRTVYVCRKMIKKVTEPNTSWILLYTAFIQIFVLLYALIETPFEDIIIFTIYIISCIVQNSIYKRRNEFNE